MTAPTPEQLRALADDVQHTVDNGYELAPENVVAALRTAAEQLEAVQEMCADALTAGERSIPLGALMLALPADTALRRTVMSDTSEQTERQQYDRYLDEYPVDAGIPMSLAEWRRR